ncbi:hypothetical protein AYL99_09827 [Fonsecaea erecta]|uniref:Uncharacterized protein n=1 Tax=Fonsecaea erecta TaxID=1367422 RepID=A0A178Z9F2_9EURO|nr:hypothetical protein AYL99_09827 [Fonsecaea erecta]OAP55675.1 hypothetical protein AYL99_09827 [Fonsecaea erecta]
MGAGRTTIQQQALEVAPTIQYIHRQPGGGRFTFTDVKFWPYSQSSTCDEPVFAVLGQTEVIIGRVSAHPRRPVTILHHLTNLFVEARVRSSTNRAAGLVEVIDAVEGKVCETHIGHEWATIHDVAVHPLYPWIFATASQDSHIRIWDLRQCLRPHATHVIILGAPASGHERDVLLPERDSQPELKRAFCVSKAELEEKQKRGVLSASWHHTGRYLVTSGFDCQVCVWTIPDLHDGSPFWRSIDPERNRRNWFDTKVIRHPHFITKAPHSNYVECVRFFGDLVVSTAALEDTIVVWRITGFDSKRRPPPRWTAPMTESWLETRNAFMRTVVTNKNGSRRLVVASEFQNRAPYERVIELAAPLGDSGYQRFGLLLPSRAHPRLHPMLAYGNAASEVCFWGLDGGLTRHTVRVDERETVSRGTKRKRPEAESLPPQDDFPRKRLTPDPPSFRLLRETPEVIFEDVSSNREHAKFTPRCVEFNKEHLDAQQGSIQTTKDIVKTKAVATEIRKTPAHVNQSRVDVTTVFVECKTTSAEVKKGAVDVNSNNHNNSGLGFHAQPIPAASSALDELSTEFPSANPVWLEALLAARKWASKQPIINEWVGTVRPYSQPTDTEKYQNPHYLYEHQAHYKPSSPAVVWEMASDPSAADATLHERPTCSDPKGFLEHSLNLPPIEYEDHTSSDLTCNKRTESQPDSRTQSPAARVGKLTRSKAAAQQGLAASSYTLAPPCKAVVEIPARPKPAATQLSLKTIPGGSKSPWSETDGHRPSQDTRPAKRRTTSDRGSTQVNLIACHSPTFSRFDGGTIAVEIPSPAKQQVESSNSTLLPTPPPSVSPEAADITGADAKHAWKSTPPTLLTPSPSPGSSPEVDDLNGNECSAGKRAYSRPPTPSPSVSPEPVDTVQDVDYGSTPFIRSPLVSPDPEWSQSLIPGPKEYPDNLEVDGERGFDDTMDFESEQSTGSDTEGSTSNPSETEQNRSVSPESAEESPDYAAVDWDLFEMQHVDQEPSDLADIHEDPLVARMLEPFADTARQDVHGEPLDTHTVSKMATSSLEPTTHDFDRLVDLEEVGFPSADDVEDPIVPVKADAKVLLPQLQYKDETPFRTRAAGWSICGRWCIVAGESATDPTDGWGGFALLHRQRLLDKDETTYVGKQLERALDKIGAILGALADREEAEAMCKEFQAICEDLKDRHRYRFGKRKLHGWMRNLHRLHPTVLDESGARQEDLDELFKRDLRDDFKEDMEDDSGEDSSGDSRETLEEGFTDDSRRLKELIHHVSVHDDESMADEDSPAPIDDDESMDDDNDNDNAVVVYDAPYRQEDVEDHNDDGGVVELIPSNRKEEAEEEEEDVDEILWDAELSSEDEESASGSEDENEDEDEDEGDDGDEDDDDDDDDEDESESHAAASDTEPPEQEEEEEDEEDEEDSGEEFYPETRPGYPRHPLQLRASASPTARFK